jgi:hypothetical protein
VLLHTNAGWFHVRVVHLEAVLRKTPPDEMGEHESAERQSSPWLRLGLRRLGEVASNPPSFSWFTGGLHFQMSEWQRSGAIGRLAVGLLVMAVVVAAPLLLARSMRQAEVSDAKKPHRSAEYNNDLIAKHPTPNDHPSGQRTAFPSAPQQHNAMLDLPGASSLLLPEVVAKLQLTRDQQRQIEQLNETTSEAIREFAAQTHGEQREDILQQSAKRLHEQARRNALQLLTASQRAKWYALIGH